MNQSTRFSDSAIKLLLVLLVVLNIIFLIVYIGAHPQENFWNQVWSYLDSNIFNIINVSLILPIILFVLESRFKIVAAFIENQHNRSLKEDEERREQKQKKREERATKRWQCIERTTQYWNELFHLSTQVSQFKKDANADSKRPDKEASFVTDVFIKLDDLENKGNDLLSTWYYCFEGRLLKDEGPFLVFCNVLIKTIYTVTMCIRDSIEQEEILELKKSLQVIQNTIRSLTYQHTISILKNSLKLMEFEEADVSSDFKETTKIMDDMKERRKDMIYWADRFLKDFVKYNNILEYDENNEEVDAFREEYKKFNEWTMVNPDKVHTLYKRMNSLSKSYENLTLENRLRAATQDFSKEYVKHLAGWIGLLGIRLSLYKPVLEE